MEAGGGGRPVEGGLQVDQISGECGGRGQQVEQTLRTFLVIKIF